MTQGGSRWWVVCTLGATLLMASSCGKTSRIRPTAQASGGEAGQNGAPSFDVETYEDFCRALVAMRCVSYSKCCANPAYGFNGELCETVEGWQCSSSEPEDFDRGAATACLELEARARQECHAPRADSELSRAVERTCSRLLTRHYAEVGEVCLEHQDCVTSESRAISCDPGYDGAIQGCYDDGPLAEEGEYCSRGENCRPGLVCVRSRCHRPSADGEPCSQNLQCASGYCCDEGTLCDDASTCNASGVLHALPSRCTTLDELSGHAVTIDPMPSPVRAIAVNQSHVYWGYERSIHRFDKQDGRIETIFEWEGSVGYNYLITDLALDDGHVYFIGNMGFGRVGLSSGEVTEFGYDPPDRPIDLAVTDDEVLLSQSGCAIARMPKELETPQYAPALVPGGFLGHLAFDEQDLFCATEETIYRAPRAGGDWEVLVVNDRRVGPVVSDGTRLWWVSNDHSGGALPGELRTMEKADPSPTTLGPALRPAGALLRDPVRQTLYWVGSNEHIGVYRDDDDTTRIFYDRLPTFSELAQDEQYLYWANEYGVMRVPKE